MRVTREQAVKAHRECVILWAGLSVMDSPYDVSDIFLFGVRAEIKQRAINILHKTGILSSSFYKTTCPYCNTHYDYDCETCPWPVGDTGMYKCCDRDSPLEIWKRSPSKSNALKVLKLLVTLDPCANIPD